MAFPTRKQMTKEEKFIQDSQYIVNDINVDNNVNNDVNINVDVTDLIGRKTPFTDDFSRQTYYIHNSFVDKIEKMCKKKPRGEKTRIINQALQQYFESLK